ncbi:MAG: thiamine phosphate synthase [Burkholderiaceae bacterium]|nr:thiamine phosphate synthase [Burkholderiaceae bacterium]
MSTTRLPRGLYGITPEWDDTERLLDAVATAARHGLRVLQLRRKDASPLVRRRQAVALQSLCRSLGVTFIVNDDWRLAADLGADGVHVGRDDASLTEVRQAVGSAVIGVSCYNDLALAHRLLAAGADYIAFGAVFPSPTKPQAVRASLPLLREAATWLRTLPRPRPSLVAIGGVTAENAAPLIEAGVDNIALITGLFAAADIGATAQACQTLFIDSLHTHHD